MVKEEENLGVSSSSNGGFLGYRGRECERGGRNKKKGRVFGVFWGLESLSQSHTIKVDCDLDFALLTLSKLIS